MRKGFASPRRIIKELFYGPEPVGAAGATVLAEQSAAELGGRMGTPHYGMRGDPALTYSGYVASPQIFQGAAQLGAKPTPPVDDVPALPNSAPPPALQAWADNWQAMEGPR